MTEDRGQLQRRCSHDVSDEAATSLSADGIAALLANRRRRYLLYCLLQYANPISLARLAEVVTALEATTSVADEPADRHRIYMSLYHHHVPKLADAGIIEYAQQEDMVELTETADQLNPMLKRTAEQDFDATDGDECSSGGDPSQ